MVLTHYKKERITGGNKTIYRQAICIYLWDTIYANHISENRR